MGEESIEVADIGRHYDRSSSLGDELRDGQMHMWYWYDDEDDASLSEALHRISRKVTDTLGLRVGEHLLDAGCGPGETALYLAKEFGVRVTGVTVSGFEIETAKRRAETSDLAERVRFQYGDYMDLPFPDGSFDAVLALESLMNAPDLTQVLGEFFRVLRPGGRISFSDFSLESAEEPDRVATFMTTLKLRVLPTLAEWIGLLGDAGFAVEEYTQCGPRVFGKKAKYIKTAMHLRDKIVTKFGDESLTEFRQIHQGFFAPRKHQIGYVIVSARKPHR